MTPLPFMNIQTREDVNGYELTIIGTGFATQQTYVYTTKAAMLADMTSETGPLQTIFASIYTAGA